MVNNNVLAALVLVAIIVAVAGIVTTLNLMSAGAPVTGAAIGYTNVTVGTSTEIFMIVSEVNFGTMNPNENNDTTDHSPPPFLIRNDGNVNVNVSLYAGDDLWDTAANPTGNFTVACGTNETTCPTGSTTTFTAVPADAPTNITVIANMSYATLTDELEVEVNVTVPPEEPAGAKSSTLTFTGYQA